MVRVFLVLICLQATARAEETDRWHLSAEGDVYVIPFSLAGEPTYSMHAAVRSPSLPRWTFALGFFGGPYPKFYRDLIDTFNGNDNDGWETHVDGVLLRALWFPRGREGWFVGGHVGVLRWEHRHEDRLSVENTNQAVLWPAVGYRVFIHRETVFLSIWTGPGVLSPNFATSRTGPERHETAHLLPFGAVHLGAEL